jgi:DNA repair exonuclease SbcCD ATPase subunit
MPPAELRPEGGPFVANGFDLLATDWEIVEEPARLDHADTVGETIQKQSATITRLEQRLLDGLAEYRDLGGQLADANKTITRLTRDVDEAHRQRDAAQQRYSDVCGEVTRLTREHSEFVTTARLRESEHEAEFARLTQSERDAEHTLLLEASAALATAESRITRLEEAERGYIATCERLVRDRNEARRPPCMSGWVCVLAAGHAGQCRDAYGWNHGTPGMDTTGRST